MTLTFVIWCDFMMGLIGKLKLCMKLARFNHCKNIKVELANSGELP